MNHFVYNISKLLLILLEGLNPNKTRGRGVVGSHDFFICYFFLQKCDSYEAGLLISGFFISYLDFKAILTGLYGLELKEKNHCCE